MVIAGSSAVSGLEGSAAEAGPLTTGRPADRTEPGMAASGPPYSVRPAAVILQCHKLVEREVVIGGLSKRGIMPDLPIVVSRRLTKLGIDVAVCKTEPSRSRTKQTIGLMMIQ